MYGHPKHLMPEDEARAAMLAFDRMATLVTPDLSVAHAPLLAEERRLLGHVARGNPFWNASPCPILVIMAGPEAYVSPGWYPSKAADGRAVPTWNYTTLHIRGVLTTFSDPGRLEDVVRRLSDRHEAGREAPWRLEDAPRPYIDRLLEGIVGLDIRIASVEGKRKLSQDRSDADRAGVIGGLGESEDPRDALLAEAMRDTLTT